MKKPIRVLFLASLCTAVAVLSGCGKPPAITFVPAPPGPADLGPAGELAPAPDGALVFDLQYLPQTGGANDIQYYSFWGFGGENSAARSNSFLQTVRKKHPGIEHVQAPPFKGREWAAIEHRSRTALALYFDLDADGDLDENERILPTRKSHQGVEFITPDFVNRRDDGTQVLCRVLLQVNFYGDSQPNCMWSPAALMEGQATLDGKTARLLLFADGPGGSFDNFGTSRHALMVGGASSQRDYIPRESLSSLIFAENEFYHLSIQGRYSNGLPARVVLVKDTTPMGSLAVKFQGTNALPAALKSLYLQGVDDPTVSLHVNASSGKLSLPEGAYALNSGSLSYGDATAQDWEVGFSKGPAAQVKAGSVAIATLGEPVLTVRAVKESDRYDQQAKESSTFKKGTRIYLEPKIVGKGGEVFSRFSQASTAKRGPNLRPPRITITTSAGAQVLSQVMEYG